jgi:exodeoxyribonuclease V alpha subunit
VICEHYSGLVSAGNAEEALAVTKRFRVLTALKRGPWGAHRLNAMIEDVLNINPHQKTFYKGQPIIVTSNDYAIGLFNGDIGVVWPDGDGKLKVWFEMSHGDDIELVPMHTQMLPSHETVFAMTVHKSQGSEFNHVLTVLPPISMSVLTRELVYTALTRTRETARIWADRHVLVDALSRKTERASGLEDQLRVSGEG